MAAARQKLIKLNITVVATKTLIAGREVEFTFAAFRIPLLVPIICQVGPLQSNARRTAHTLAYWIKLEVLQEPQGNGAAWRNAAQRDMALTTPWEFPVNVTK
jgi:hypothetical protein